MLTFEYRRLQRNRYILDSHVDTKIQASVVELVANYETPIVAIEHLSPDVARISMLRFAFYFGRNDFTPRRSCNAAIKKKHGLYPSVKIKTVSGQAQRDTDFRPSVS